MSHSAATVIDPTTGKPVRAPAHHFDSGEAEFEASKQGLWVFLITEVLFFSGLFVAYFILKFLYPEMVLQAHHALDWRMGAINTVVLICSSLTMALGVRAAAEGKNAKCAKLLTATFLLACCFLVVKFFEYQHKFHDGLLPGMHFLNPEYPLARTPLFFSVYFVMTGVHGIHVIGGMGVIAWLIKRALNNEFAPSYYTPVECVGLYWHFVDLVWIYLFPLLYLVS